MEKQYQLSVTDDTTAINVDTIDPEMISRMMTLAGMPTPAPMPPMPPIPAPVPPGATSISMPPSPESGEVPHPIDMPFDDECEMSDEGGCSVCGAEDHSEIDCPDVVASPADPESGMIGEIADFDIATQDNDSEGHEVDKDTYTWQGPSTPQRMVKGMQGDNPLMVELHTKLLADYAEYLSESENEDGQMSPLSDPTKPEFDKDPTSGEEAVTDGTRSPLSRIVRQPAFK